MKYVLVMGAGGFIGSHMVKRIKETQENVFVVGVDLKIPEYQRDHSDYFFRMDLREKSNIERLFKRAPRYDEIYQFAADMGGAGFIFNGTHDSEIMYNSVSINLNLIDVASKHKSMIDKIFYSSSACVYPQENQIDPKNPHCDEKSAYPANPDSEYGWEKLFSERLYLAAKRNNNLNVRIARYHNIFGPFGTYDGGREKAPAALSRKIAEAKIAKRDHITIWGDGKQTRSFLYIDDCLDGTLKLMDSNKTGPYNIGSEEMVTINELAKNIMEIANIDLKIKHIKGPLGVRGRNSDNKLVKNELHWEPKISLNDGLIKTYNWIEKLII